MAAFQGHPNLSPADFAALHQQHQQQQAMLYQAQQDFEKQQREAGCANLQAKSTYTDPRWYSEHKAVDS